MELDDDVTLLIGRPKLVGTNWAKSMNLNLPRLRVTKTAIGIGRDQSDCESTGRNWNIMATSPEYDCKWKADCYKKVT